MYSDNFFLLLMEYDWLCENIVEDIVYQVI